MEQWYFVVFTLKIKHFSGYCAGDGPSMDHHCSPGAMRGCADGGTFLPLWCSHRSVVQNASTQQGRGYNWRFIRARKRLAWTNKQTREWETSQQRSYSWCRCYFSFFNLSMKNVQVCFTKEGRGWSSVGRAGRNWKCLLMIWETAQTPVRWENDGMINHFLCI